MKKEYNYNFIKKFKMANLISIFFVLISLILIIFKGLNFGIDFKGGTLIELRVESNNIKINDIRSAFSNMDLGDLNVKEFGKKGDYLIKFEKKEFNKIVNIKSIKESVVNKLGVDVNFRRIENVGPKVSAELLNSGLIAICLALGAMLFYIWIRFEWQFSLGSIVAIFHDVLITIGIFSILSLEVNLSIVAAVLTIVGYSMNDTVVIYDRIRENLSKYSSSTIDDVSNTSINETLSRTIITSVTTLLALVSIYVLGGEILKGFSLAMIIGVIIGTYSSIFVASPILKYLRVSYKSIAKEEEKN
ncbi:protein translocase subunit SecF [Pelagibacteraceae bacterium]|nr:protein translocase subunit SecF [Pelagibacteraceae bacterium]